MCVPLLLFVLHSSLYILSGPIQSESLRDQVATHVDCSWIINDFVIFRSRMALSDTF